MGDSNRLIKVALVTAGRTGSTAIIDELGRTEKSCSMQEIFSSIPQDDNDLAVSSFIEYQKINNNLRIFLSEGLIADTYLRYLHEKAREANKEVFFWKVLWNHFSERPYLTQLLMQNDYRIIYLKRNVFRQVLSGMVAKQRGLYNTTGDFDKSKKYSIDIDDLRNQVRWQHAAKDQFVEVLSRSSFKYITVDYEDYILDRGRFFGKIFDFLGYRCAELPQQTSYKRMIDDVQSTIINYEEVKNVAFEFGEML